MATRRDRRGQTELTVLTETQERARAQRQTFRDAERAARYRERSTGGQGIGGPGAAPPKESPVGQGVLVQMYKIPHLTDPDLLRVPFYFQCPPLDSIPVSAAANWSTWQTIRRGEFISPGGRTLQRISFATLFLSYNMDWTFTHGDSDELISGDPQQAVRALRQILRSNTPFGLSISHEGMWSRPDVHWFPGNGNAAVLVSLDAEERAGEPDARYTNVTFQEFRSPDLDRRRKGKRRHDHKRGRGVPTYVLVRSDGRVEEGKAQKPITRNADLRELAKHFYGRQAGWRTIVAANPKLKNVAASRSLGSWLRSRHVKQERIFIPELPTATTNSPRDDDVD